MFREEVVKNRTDNSFGEVGFFFPVSYNYVFMLIIAITVLFFIFSFTQYYRKKETVFGYIIPSKGVIKMYSPSDGYISNIKIKEGDPIKKNQVIAILNNLNPNRYGKDLNKKITKEINNQIHSISSKIINTSKLYHYKEININSKIIRLKNEIKFIEEQINSASEKKNILRNQYYKYKGANKMGYFSSVDEESKKIRYLSSKQKVYELKEEKEKVIINLNQLYHEIKKIPIELLDRLESLKLEKSKLKNKLFEQLGQEKLLIRSNEPGIITGLNIKEGKELKSHEYLFSILPKNSKMEVGLLVPTRAFGLVKKGLKVRVKIDAFPYQKYGSISGIIKDITKSIILPNDIKSPISINEPYYKVVVELKNQYIETINDKIHLQSGMTVNADIITDERTIIEWILTPFKGYFS